MATEDKDNASEASSMDIKGSSAAAEEASQVENAVDSEDKQKEASAPGPGECLTYPMKRISCVRMSSLWYTASKLLQSSYDVKVSLH